MADIFEDWGKLLALGFLAVAIGLLQDLVPKPAKEWLVFWKCKNRLPGYRAFSKDRKFSSIISRQEVVDISARESLGERYQDRLFYQLYDKFREKGNVQHYSFRYLQWRELAATALIAEFVGGYYIANNVGVFTLEFVKFASVNMVIVISSIFAARGAANLLVDYVLLNERLSKGGS